MDCVSEEVVEEEIVEAWVLVEGCFDVPKESDLRNLIIFLRV